jgi:asparagine N-glycosylation enzyme membrane subunit Stt3
MSYDTFYKIGQTFEDDLQKFGENYYDGAWCLRYISGALLFIFAYLCIEFLGEHHKSGVAGFAWLIGIVMTLFAAIMWREVVVVILGLLAAYWLYVTLDAAIDKSPVTFAIFFSAAWIVWAIKSKP